MKLSILLAKFRAQCKTFSICHFTVFVNVAEAEPFPVLSSTMNDIPNLSNLSKTTIHRTLLQILEVLDKEQLDCVPTVYCSATDEYLPIDRFVFASGQNQVLDTDHPYFHIDA